MRGGTAHEGEKQKTPETNLMIARTKPARTTALPRAVWPNPEDDRTFLTYFP
jgi:hypothetical protein